MCIFKIFSKKKQTLPKRNLNEIKNGCRVLFIDDQKFDIVDRLKNQEGWKNTTRIKDLDSISQTELVDAHIVLVDVQGVGKKMQCPDEGLGLIVAVKQKYPQKKVIMYSGESQGKIETFHEAWNVADHKLKKTSTQYEFNNIIEKFAKESFCLENCIARIKSILYNEYSISLDEHEIESKLNKIISKGCSESTVSSILNIQNAAAICEIIQLFLSIH